jgi:hypothetical protein
LVFQVVKEETPGAPGSRRCFSAITWETNIFTSEVFTSEVFVLAGAPASGDRVHHPQDRTLAESRCGTSNAEAAMLPVGQEPKSEIPFWTG